jgi:hypothetical protein
MLLGPIFAPPILHHRDVECITVQGRLFCESDGAFPKRETAIFIVAILFIGAWMFYGLNRAWDKEEGAKFWLPWFGIPILLVVGWLYFS